MAKPDWDWISAKIVQILPPVFVALFLGFLVYRYLYYREVFFASDFSHYWVAGRLAWAGDPAAVYDFPRLQAFGRTAAGITLNVPWFNTPTFLMLFLPFALLPLQASLFVWVLSTLGGYLAVMRRLAPHPQFTWLALAFPSTLLNINYGQNGFLSVIFLGGGLLLLERAPVAAGIFLGLMTYKPHLAVLIPIALAAGRHWRALAAMAGTGVGLMGASALLFGLDIWGTFFQKITVMLGGLQGGRISATNTLPLWKMPTVFAAVQGLGAGPVAAAVTQGLLGLLIVALVVRVWRSRVSPAIAAAVLVLGTFLVTPYAFVYDNILIALALVGLGWEGYTKGWLPGEKLVLALAWVAPIYLSFHHCRWLLLPIVLLLLLALRRLRAATLGLS